MMAKHLVNPLQPFLDRCGVVILDGALATELERRSADLNDPLWSARLLLEAPDLIRAVHADYFMAGADVATTASYQATFAGFARRGLDHKQAATLMRLSVDLAAQARDEFWAHYLVEPKDQCDRLRPLVAASIGPYGAYLADGSEYRGDYGLSVEELMDFHRPRMAVLVATNADLLACETIPCQAEGEALVRLLAEFPDTPAWLSFSCGDGDHVCHGEPFADCVRLAEQSEQIVAVGLNCTAPRFVAELLAHARSATAKPLLVYPNSGERWDAAAHCWVADTQAGDFAALASAWYAQGARLIGGCCRTTPADIQSVVRALRMSEL
jgi:homocysteine S-methyltransferase